MASGAHLVLIYLLSQCIVQIVQGPIMALLHANPVISEILRPTYIGQLIIGTFCVYLASDRKTSIPDFAN